MKSIETPKMSEILREEFLIPYNLSAYRLTKAINVPNYRIYNILYNKSNVDAELSIRLGRFFGVSDNYFLTIQCNIDIHKAKMTLMNDVLKVKTIRDD